MKNLFCLALGLAALGAYSVSRPSSAQDVPKDNMRYEITAAIGKLVDAANRADTDTVMAMISTKPEVTVLSDGEMYLGTSDIRAHAERLLGQRGKYMFQLGSMTVANVNGLAVATAPYTLRSGDGSQTISARGAVTFLMVKSGRRWLVAHMHRSTTPGKPQLD
jgi:ketosteroid isomerase-like protein